MSGIKLLFGLGLLLMTRPASAQSGTNQRLKHELDSLLVEDQKYRQFIGPLSPSTTDSLAKAWQVPSGQLLNHIITSMNQADARNLRRGEFILKQYGYPGKSLVGEPANEAAWYVIQHSDKIAAYLPLVKAAAEKGELPFRLYAMMLDRQRMYDGQAQLYGTQGASFNLRDKATGKAETVSFIWPVENPTQVNARRKQAGFQPPWKKTANG